MMRRLASFLLLVLGPGLGPIAGPNPASAAGAVCPPACIGGGGPVDTDCFLQFGGIASTAVTCTDGDPSCDTDGTVNGVCALALTACVNTPGGACAATPLWRAPSVKGKKDPNATALNTALGLLPLAEPGCTPSPYPVKIKVDVGGLKPGVSKLSFRATAGKKTDKDKLTLTCTPGAAPSLAGVLEPIFTAKCATPACHQSLSPSGGLNMEVGNSYGETVGVASVSTLARGLKIIAPGSVKQSYLARKILGKGLARFDSIMPQGCPGVPTVPCLTDEEKVQILTWIQAGAPNN